MSTKDLQQQPINLKAEWYIRAEDMGTGEIVHEERKENLIVRAARQDVLYHIFGLTGAINTGFFYLGAGTSTTPAAITDAALTSELTANDGTNGNPNGRVPCTNTSNATLSPSDVMQQTSGGFDQVITLQGVFIATDNNNGHTFAEYGLFSAQAFGTGTMWNHYVSGSPIAKTSSIRIVVQITIRV